MRYINSIKSGFGVMISDVKRTASAIMVIVLAWCMSPLIAQDPVYSQFYNAHLQLNAAMAGNTRGPLIQMNYRNQWPGLGNIYTTYSVSYDQYISKLKSGLGFILLTDNAGDGVLRSTGLTGFYSYRVRVRDEIYIKGGIEAGFVNMSLDWNKLQFGDAIDPSVGPISPGGTPFPSQESIPGSTKKNYLNIGAGAVLYNPKYYVGLSLKNLNTPDISFLNGENGGSSAALALPVRITLHGGTQILLKKGNKNTEPTFISPNAIFLRQSGYNQLNLGAYLSVDKIQGGLWYRHSLYNGDALITSFGVKKDFLKITYSFDLTLSQLSIRQGGSHEIGVIFNFDYLYPKKQDYNDCFAIFR
ncbi:MAG: type IX secretion system membrane protein PorP/SprF [Saprospiraceae bacterium]|nr:type IX secretion system membrane protein PorP/SprF [Saprospiraceae bacterium]